MILLVENMESLPKEVKTQKWSGAYLPRKDNLGSTWIFVAQEDVLLDVRLTLHPIFLLK